jgi:hypothetical protein
VVIEFGGGSQRCGPPERTPGQISGVGCGGLLPLERARALAYWELIRSELMYGACMHTAGVLEELSFHSCLSFG